MRDGPTRFGNSCASSPVQGFQELPAEGASGCAAGPRPMATRLRGLITPPEAAILRKRGTVQIGALTERI